MEKENLAPRARFELATLRLTAEQPTSSELAGVGPNRRKSASCDETGRIIFSFSSHRLFAFCRHSPPLVLRFYDSAYRYSLSSIFYGDGGSNPDLSQNEIAVEVEELMS
jgi:hypothetical protein